MTANELAEKHVHVTSTPQGTADVYLDEVHIKVYGGGAASITSANHFKANLVAAIQAILEEWDGKADRTADSVPVAAMQTEPMAVTVGDVGSLEEVMPELAEKDKKHWYQS